MNKRGFIRILEAIIALIIVLAYVISILPKAQEPTGDVPAELVAMQKTIIDAVQNDARFRSCIIAGNVYDPSVVGEDKTKSDTECVDVIVRDALPVFSVWKYAFKICKTKSLECKFAKQDVPAGKKEGEALEYSDEAQFAAEVLPLDRAVYAKSVLVSVQDVTSSFAPGQSPTTEYKIITIYMWSVV